MCASDQETTSISQQHRHRRKVDEAIKLMDSFRDNKAAASQSYKTRYCYYTLVSPSSFFCTICIHPTGSCRSFMNHICMWVNAHWNPSRRNDICIKYQRVLSTQIDLTTTVYGCCEFNMKIPALTSVTFPAETGDNCSILCAITVHFVSPANHELVNCFRIW